MAKKNKQQQRRNRSSRDDDDDDEHDEEITSTTATTAIDPNKSTTDFSLLNALTEHEEDFQNGNLELWAVRLPASVNLSCLNQVELNLSSLARRLSEPPQQPDHGHNNYDNPVVGQFYSGMDGYDIRMGHVEETESFRVLVTTKSKQCTDESDDEDDDENESNDHKKQGENFRVSNLSFSRHLHVVATLPTILDAPPPSAISATSTIVPTPSTTPIHIASTSSSSNASLPKCSGSLEMRHAYAPEPQKSGLQRRWAPPGATTTMQAKPPHVTITSAMPCTTVSSKVKSLKSANSNNDGKNKKNENHDQVNVNEQECLGSSPSLSKKKRKKHHGSPNHVQADSLRNLSQENHDKDQQRLHEGQNNVNHNDVIHSSTNTTPTKKKRKKEKYKYDVGGQTNQTERIKNEEEELHNNNNNNDTKEKQPDPVSSSSKKKRKHRDTSSYIPPNSISDMTNEAIKNEEDRRTGGKREGANGQLEVNLPPQLVKSEEESHSERQHIAHRIIKTDDSLATSLLIKKEDNNIKLKVINVSVAAARKQKKAGDDDPAKEGAPLKQENDKHHRRHHGENESNSSSSTKKRHKHGNDTDRQERNRNKKKKDKQK